MSHQVEDSDQIPPEILAEGYETRDLNVPVIWVWTLATVVTVVVSYILLDGLYTYELTRLKKEREMGGEVGSFEGFEKRATDRAILSSYGKSSGEAGEYRMPIDDAMAKIAADDAAARTAN